MTPWMLKDARKFMARKFKKISYENTRLPEGYEDTTEEYRRVRDDLDMLASALKNIANYEHGGQFMKKLTSFTNTLSSSARIKSLHSDDIYTNAAAVGEHMSQGSQNQGLLRVCGGFSQAFCTISESKAKMNEKMGNVLVSLSALKKDSKKVDEARKNAEELRYKLEEMIQDGNYAESERNKREAEFNFAAADVLTKMKEFVGESGVVSLLKQAADVYRAFLQAGAEALSTVK